MSVDYINLFLSPNFWLVEDQEIILFVMPGNVRADFQSHDRQSIIHKDQVSPMFYFQTKKPHAKHWSLKQRKFIIGNKMLSLKM